MKVFRIALYSALVIVIAQTLFASDTTKFDPTGERPHVTKSFLEIYQDRVVHVNFTIFPGTLTLATKKVLEMPKNSTYYIIINTPGGAVSDGIKFVNAIQAVKKAKNAKAICLIEDNAYSMGAIISSYCHETYINNLVGSVMYHQIAFGISGQIKQVKDYIIFIEKWAERLERALALQMGMNYDTYKDMTKLELWLNNDDAVSYGFVDGYYDMYFIVPENEPFIRRVKGYLK